MACSFYCAWRMLHGQLTGLPFMQSSPSAGNAWAHLNQNTWPAVAGSSDQAALQAQALALQLSLQASGNLDQARQLPHQSHLSMQSVLMQQHIGLLRVKSGQSSSMLCGGEGRL